MNNNYQIYWAGYHPQKSVQAKAIFYVRNELLKIYGSKLTFKFVSDIGDLNYNAVDLLDLVENGEIDCCYFYSSYLTDRVPELDFFEIPFQISSREHIYRMLDGKFGKYIEERVYESTGYKVLGWWDNGIRHITSNKTHIRSISDCKSSCMRIAKNDMHKRAFEGIGFKTKFVDVKELQNAIKLNIIDTQENPLTNIINYGIENFHQYITLSSHLFGTSILLCNKNIYNSWSDTFKENMAKIIKNATKYQRSLAIAEDAKCMKELLKKGIKVETMKTELRENLKKISLNATSKKINEFPTKIYSEFTNLS